MSAIITLSIKIGKGECIMFCTKCGTQNAEGVSFCTSCGNALNAAPAVEAAPVAQEPEAPASTNLVDKVKSTAMSVLAPVKPMLEKVKPFIEKYKLFVVAGAGLLALIICISLLVAIFSGGSGYDAYKHYIGITIDDGEIVILYDNKKPKNTGLEADGLDSTRRSIDGSIAALLTSDGDLAFVKGTKLTKIDEEVEFFMMSADGTGIAYVTENDDGYTLNLYNTKNKKSKVVTKNLYGNNFELSPNGDSVCYFEMKEDDDEASLMFFKGSKSTKITSDDVSLLGLSNNGKYIYVIGENSDGEEMLYRFNKKGNRDKIGKISDSDVYFNKDHTQIAYFSSNDGSTRTYISTKGKEGVKISSSEAFPILPNNTNVVNGRYSYTLATKTLFNKVYECDGEKGTNVWFIRKNADKSEKLVGGVYGITLSENGKMLYYIDGDELMVLTVKHGDKAADRAKKIAEDVDDYVVTSDCKKVYYESDNALYCVNGKTGRGKKTVATENISYLTINGKDVVYYIMEDDAYASKNGSKGKKVVSDADYIYGMPNGLVYVYTEDGTIYATMGAKKPSKIMAGD